MKKILLIIAVFSGLIASSQVLPPGHTEMNGGYRFLRILAKSMHIPSGCDTATAVKPGQWPGAGAIYLDSCAHIAYIRSGGAWRTMGGGGAGNDSAYVNSDTITGGFVLIRDNNQRDTFLLAGTSYRLNPTQGYGITYINDSTVRADTATLFPAVRATIPPGGISTVGTINSQSKSSNGAVISGASIYQQTVDATYPGLMTPAQKARLDSNSYIAIDKTLDSLAWYKNDSTLYIKSINLSIPSATVTKTITDSTINYAVTGISGGSSYTIGPGLKDSLGVLKVDNRRDIQYITQPTTGSSIGADWTAVGTPSVTYSSGNFVFTGSGPGNYTKYIRSNKGTLMEFSSVQATVTYNTVTGTDAGIAIGLESYNPHGYAHSMRMEYVSDQSSGNYGKVALTGSFGAYASYSTESRAAAAGDVMTYRLERWGLEYKATVINVTQGWKLQKIVAANPNGVPFVANNSAYPAVYHKGGAFTVSGFKYTIHAPLFTDILDVGNSITTGQAATTELTRWVSRTGTPSLNMFSGGGADVSQSILTRINEIIALRPRRVILFDPAGNDILFAVATATWKANITAIRDSLVANGIEVIWAFSPRTATDVSAQKIFVDTSSTFRSDLKIDTWTALLGTGTAMNALYDADGTHPNNRGEAVIAAVINEALHFQNGTNFNINGTASADNGSISGMTTGLPSVGLTGSVLFKGTGTGYGQGGYNAINEGFWLQSIKPAVGYMAMQLNPAGGSVGIGQEVPTSLLHLKNAVAPALTFEKTGVGNWLIGNTPQTSNTDFRFRWGAFDWMTMQVGGNIGIHNNLPISTFDITGSFRVSDTALFNGQRYFSGSIYNSSTALRMVVIDTVTGKEYRQIIPTGGGGAGVSSVSAGTGMAFTTITSTGPVNADTTMLSTRAWRDKLKDSLVGLIAGGSYVNNQFATPQTSARFWISGSGRADSSLYGRTTGAMNASNSAGLIAYSNSGTNKQFGLGYDGTLNSAWMQGLNAGTSYTDIIAQKEGGRFGIGAHTALPASLLHLKQSFFPAIRLEKTGAAYWTVGRRLEDNTTTFNISYNTSDWINLLATGETGFGGNTSPTAWVSSSAGTTTIGQLNLPSGVLKSSPTSGDITNVSGILKFYNGAQKRIPHSNDAAPSNGQILIGNGTDYTVQHITPTTNQVNVANGSGTITLSTPQDIHTAATPQFGGLGIGTAGSSASAIAVAGSGYTQPGVNIIPSVSPAASANMSVLQVGGTIVENSTNTHAFLAGTTFSPPVITGGAATVGNAATVNITGATTATVTGRNLALLVTGETFVNAVSYRQNVYTSNTTLNETNYTVFVDATSGNVTITLPAAAGIDGRVYVIKKIDGSANTVTIDGNGSETIDGTTTKILGTQYEGMMIQTNNANWFIISTF